DSRIDSGQVTSVGHPDVIMPIQEIPRKMKSDVVILKVINDATRKIATA
ncbi:hypothetical protein TNCV_3617961, partial [Trichonephila clavipes]